MQNVQVTMSSNNYSIAVIVFDLRNVILWVNTENGGTATDYN